MFGRYLGRLSSAHDCASCCAQAEAFHNFGFLWYSGSPKYFRFCFNLTNVDLCFFEKLPGSTTCLTKEAPLGLCDCTKHLWIIFGSVVGPNLDMNICQQSGINFCLIKYGNDPNLQNISKYHGHYRSPPLLQIGSDTEFSAQTFSPAAVS